MPAILADEHAEHRDTGGTGSVHVGRIRAGPAYEEARVVDQTAHRIDLAGWSRAVERVEDGWRVDRGFDVEGDRGLRVDACSVGCRLLGLDRVLHQTITGSVRVIGRQQSTLRILGSPTGLGINRRQSPHSAVACEVEKRHGIHEEALRLTQVQTPAEGQPIGGHIYEDVAELHVAQPEAAQVEVVVEGLHDLDDLRGSGRRRLVLEANRERQGAGRGDETIESKALRAEHVVGVFGQHDIRLVV